MSWGKKQLLIFVDIGEIVDHHQFTFSFYSKVNIIYMYNKI
jgi:hypothetical protein